MRVAARLLASAVKRRTMKVAVEGCSHGELDKIYDTLEHLEKKEDVKPDVLLVCGDFQAVRNWSDLNAMAVPAKYQSLNTFWKYYNGQKKAPVLTICIGGNHEASNYMQELPYGGWLAPNIYYLGYAGVVNYGGLRIGGMSGIYKENDFYRGHFEKPPYDEHSKRSVYHTRQLEVFRLKQIKKPIDIFMSHDWPQGIYKYGNKYELLNAKPDFEDEIRTNSLGSKAGEILLHHLQPDYWFSAHLHVKFPAIVQHQTKTTKFLALDKCDQRRDFLQVIDVPVDGDKPLSLELDPEWMCILKNTNHLLTLSSAPNYMPGPGSTERHDFSATPEDLQAVEEDFQGLYKIPNNFQVTAPALKHNKRNLKQVHQPVSVIVNPQTTLLCEMLGLTDPMAVFQKDPNFKATQSAPNFEEADYDSDDEPPSFINSTLDTSQDVSGLNNTTNPDEIPLSDGTGSENESGSDDIEPIGKVGPRSELDFEDDDPRSAVWEGDVGGQRSRSQSPMGNKPGSSSPERKQIGKFQPPLRKPKTDDDRFGAFAASSSPINPKSNPHGIAFEEDEPILSNFTKKSGSSPLRKRSSGESDTSFSSSVQNKTQDSDLDTSQEGKPAATKAKKMKRRNEKLYMSTDGDSSS